VGRRLRANLRPGDLAARLGGDEFAVLMWARPVEAERIAQRLLGVLCQPYEQPQGTVFLTASIGLAGCATADDVPSLLRNADLALRFAKQRGKSRVEEYDVAYDKNLRRRTLLEHELRGAVDRGELHLVFQPVVALPSVRPVGAEALLRWHHPELGQVSPLEFIPIAEESGAIIRLGSWVLHQACHQLSRWLADGHDVWVSVNVSPRELHSPEYVVQVAEALEAHRVPPQRLVLEVTEHAVATDLDELVRRLRALRMTGVRIALDDFGAGYSSLGQLRNLPVDILKIDQSLVAEPESSRTGTAAPLVDVVVRLGHRLGLEVIAEGMAEPQQLTVVEAAGCRWGQGWLFGAPVPAEHLEARLAAVSGPAVRPRQRGDAKRDVAAAGGPEAGVPAPAVPPVSPQAMPAPTLPPRQPTTLPAQSLRPVDSAREMRQA
jgi:predicted signal transduction protein with EAL and GGDEF domain